MVRTPLAVFKQYRERLRFRYGPKVAGWVLDRATAKARSELSTAQPLRILIDNTVLGLAITHETAWIQTGVIGCDPTKRGTGYAARIPVHDRKANERDYKIASYLTGIAHLCRSGHITPFSSEELEDERIRQPAGRFTGYGYFDLNLFKGVRFQTVGEPTYLILGAAGFGLPSAKEQQARRMLERRKVDAEYDLLVRRLGEKSSNDAWHIIEAERHGMFCFLTTDFKLIKSVRRQGKLKPLSGFKVLVLSPEELGLKLGIRRVPPAILSYQDASFFVRPDLAMPGGKRRPSIGYSSSDRPR